jgi:MFS family permease
MRSRVAVKGLVFTSAGHFINDGDVFFIPLVADIFAGRNLLSPLDLTLMFTVFYASASILSAYVGRVADTTGRAGPMIGLGLTLLSAGLLGFYFSLVYLKGMTLAGSVLISAFLAGFGSAFYHPLSASILQTEFEGKQLGRALGVNGSIGSLGRAIYPTLFFVVGVVLANYGSLAFFGFMGLLAAAAISIGLKEKTEDTFSKSRVDENQSGARKAVTKGIVVLTVLALIRSLATNGVVAWIPIYMSTQRGLGVTGNLGLALTTMYAAAIVAQPIFGWTLDKVDKRFVVAITPAGAGLSILGYIYTTGALSTVMIAAFGLFTFSAFPILLSIAPDYLPYGSTNLGNALVWGIGISGGQVLGPLIVGAIVLRDYANLNLAFNIMALASFAAAIGVLFLPKPSKKGKTGLMADSVFD